MMHRLNLASVRLSVYFLISITPNLFFSACTAHWYGLQNVYIKDFILKFPKRNNTVGPYIFGKSKHIEI